MSALYLLYFITWICYLFLLLGGDNYRDEIARAVEEADVVILMLNNEWALSRECQDEFNFAKRLNLDNKSRGIII